VSTLSSFHQNVLLLYGRQIVFPFEASSYTCFEKRLGGLEGTGTDDFSQQMVNANQHMLANSLQLRFSVPWWRLFRTPSWTSLVQSEDFFFG
jgi:hypothetical protein